MTERGQIQWLAHQAESDIRRVRDHGVGESGVWTWPRRSLATGGCGKGAGLLRVLEVSGTLAFAGPVGCLAAEERRGRLAGGFRWSHAFLERDRCGWPTGQEYSRKVPQQAWTRVDWSGRRRTMTCTGILWWTVCRWIACKRSGVRISLAPSGQPHNSNNLKRDFERLAALPGDVRTGQLPLTTSSYAADLSGQPADLLRTRIGPRAR